MAWIGKYPQSEAGPTQKMMRILAPAVPYITVGAGVMILHNVWAAIITYHLAMLLILVFSRPGVPPERLVQGRDYRVPVITAIFGSMGGLLLYLLWPLVSTAIDLNSALQNIQINSATWTVLIPYLILINPWLEEWYWRGYLGSDTKQITINDLLFSGYHLLILAGKIEVLWLIIIFVILFCGAWSWRQINRLNRGLLASYTSHLAADTTIMIAIYCIVMNY